MVTNEASSWAAPLTSAKDVRILGKERDIASASPTTPEESGIARPKLEGKIHSW